MEETQNYYITPPTVFLPEHGIKIAFIGTDSEWVENLTDSLENTFQIPMTFYHLDDASNENWQWLHLMVEQSDLIMINLGICNQIEMMLATMNIGTKAWFYIDPKLVDKNTRTLLNTVAANTFMDAEQLHNMLRAFLGND